MKKNQKKICISNWNKPTPLFWKRLGDTCIYSLPLLEGVILSSPLNSEAKMWINFALGIVLVSAKAFSKFFAEETKK